MSHGVNTNNICPQVANLFQPNAPGKDNFLELQKICSMSKMLHFVSMASQNGYDKVGRSRNQSGNENKYYLRQEPVPVMVAMGLRMVGFKPLLGLGISF